MKSGATIHSRLAEALGSAEPTRAALNLAKALKSEGMSQVAMYRLFAVYQETLDAKDSRYDAVLDVLTSVWGGPWAKGSDLFDDELTDERLHQDCYDDREQAVAKLVSGLKAGAYCETIFCECLIEIACELPAERLWAVLPEDLRGSVIRWMLEPECQQSYSADLLGTESFRQWCEFLQLRRIEQ
jgi:hypothetical protein